MDRKGYTLWEIIVTLAIAGIITTLAIQNFAAPSPHRQLREATQTLRGYLQAVRQKAIAEGKEEDQTLTVTFNPKGTYSHPDLGEQTLPPDVDFGTLAGISKDPTGKPIKNPTTGFFSGENIARFDSNGTITNGTIYLTTKEETTATRISQAGGIRQYQWSGQGWKGL